jgi:monofunctional biosynthetic peptidoglycan transglycosylase
MGGVSLGDIVAIDNGLRFHGKLSLENNGGFASVRRLFHGDLENVRGIRLRVHGDGRRYQFRVRVDDNYDGNSWRHVFDTDDSWQTVELLIDDFEPGRILHPSTGLSPG